MTQEKPRSPLIDQVERMKQAAAQREVAELQRLVEAYRMVYERTQKEVTLLLKAIEDQGGTPTKTQVTKMVQYRQLLDEVEREVARYADYVTVEMRQAVRASVLAGEEDARRLMEVALLDSGANITAAQLRTLNPEVIEQLVGFLDPRGELFRRLGDTKAPEGLARWTSKMVGDAILEGVGLGENPRTIARRIQKQIIKNMGRGLTSTMTTVRTVQLYAYREANRASYNANPEVCTGWVWVSAKDARVCPGCLSMDGTEHDLSEPLQGHHNCRCVAVPKTVLNPKPLDETGEQWFAKQPEALQKKILGKGVYDQWKNGAVQFGQLHNTYEDDVYGTMVRASTLEELTGRKVTG